MWLTNNMSQMKYFVSTFSDEYYFSEHFIRFISLVEHFSSCFIQYLVNVYCYIALGFTITIISPFVINAVCLSSKPHLLIHHDKLCRKLSV